MQTVAEMWLIVQLTGSGAAVGLTAGLQFVPILLFGAGRLLADRLSKRRVLMVTQALMALPALALFALTVAGSVTPLIVWARSVFVRGTVNAIDNPTRQSFVIELVGAERVVNAVSLNSVIVQRCATNVEGGWM